MEKTKGISKKPELKEKVVEKVTKLQKPVVKVTPLEEFDDYKIKREKGKIIFGCGEVTISKPRMQRFANILADSQLVKSLKGVDTKIETYREKVKNHYNYPAIYNDISISELKDWINIKENKENQNHINFLKQLGKDTGDRYSIDDLLELNPKTVLGIIG